MWERDEVLFENGRIQNQTRTSLPRTSSAQSTDSSQSRSFSLSLYFDALSTREKGLNDNETRKPNAENERRSFKCVPANSASLICSSLSSRRLAIRSPRNCPMTVRTPPRDVKRMFNCLNNWATGSKMMNCEKSSRWSFIRLPVSQRWTSRKWKQPWRRKNWNFAWLQRASNKVRPCSPNAPNWSNRNDKW